jgi:hypothetical protein
MRITSRQLRQIIKEELTRSLKEAEPGDVTTQAVTALPSRPKYGEDDPALLKRLNDRHRPLVRLIVSKFATQVRDGTQGPFNDLDTDKVFDSEYLKEMFESNSDVLHDYAISTIGYDMRGELNFPQGQWMNGVINDAVKVIGRSARTGVRNEVQPPVVTGKNILSRLDSTLDSVLSNR